MLQVLMQNATALLVLNYPETYVFKSWHGTLFTIAILNLSVTFNTFFAQKLHLVVRKVIVIPVKVTAEWPEGRTDLG